MNALETAIQADKVAQNLENIGYRCIICDYAFDQGFNPTRLAANTNRAILTLSDQGFKSALPISSQIYRNRYGDDIDFPALLGMSINKNSSLKNINFDYFYSESLYRQKLRGFASRIEELIRATRPDIIVIQQGAEVLSRIILSKAMKFGIRWLLSESSFLPGYLLLDPCGQHFMRGYNQIDCDWPEWVQRPLDKRISQEAERYVEQWKLRRISKYQQSDIPAPSLTAFLALPGHILFVPMQIADDANVHYGLGVFPSLADFYQDLINALPENWRIVFKQHPFDQHSPSFQATAPASIFVTKDGNIHDLIQKADAVAVFSSNVGLESIFYGKAVIVGGKPCYGGKGLTLDVEHKEDLNRLIKNSIDWLPDLTIRQKLISYLLFEYLIADNDADAMRKKIRRTDTFKDHPTTSYRRPFSEADPESCSPSIEAAHNFERLVEDGFSNDEIIKLLGLNGKNENIHRPLTMRKNWPLPWINQQDEGVVEAYQFAAHIVPPHSHILDFGCGNGFGPWYLAITGLKITACDTEPTVIEYAQNNWNHCRIDYRLISQINFGSGRISQQTFPLILLIDTLSYSHQPDQLLSTIWRSVAFDGACLLRIPHPDTTVGRSWNCPVQLLNEKSLKNLASNLPDLAGIHTTYQTKAGFSQKPNTLPCSYWVLLAKGDKSTSDKWKDRMHEANSASYPRLKDISIGNIINLVSRRRGKFLKFLNLSINRLIT